MSTKLTTKINTKHRPSLHRRRLKHRRKKLRTKKFRKLSLVGVSLVYLMAFVAMIGSFNYLHALNSELPTVDTPFSAYGLASNILDRNDTELYTIAGDFLRDPLDLNEVPEHVIWAFLAAEDIRFYEHTGIEPAAMARCALLLAEGNTGSICGGSTITQQLVKMTSVGNEFSIDRKLREILLSTKVEDSYQKSKILEQYLSVVPMGSNIYGISVGAQFYFGKTTSQLTLAEAALLASIIQNPVHLSPTLGYPDPETAQKLVMERQRYVLRQIESNMNYINDSVRGLADDIELDDVITPEMIANARNQKLKFRDPIFTNKKAGHFVDYVQHLLTTRPYNNGEAFTSAELAFGGYTIHTTLDYRLQRVAEQTVLDAVKSGRGNWGGHNAAMMTMKPKTGEILVMVGSKSYYKPSSGCNKKGKNCKFNPQVNILTTKQSPGSSTKPFGYYEAFRTGKLYTGSLLPDVPIDVGGGYNLKNWNGTFFGVSPKTFASQMLCESRNLPAVLVYELIGRKGFLNTMNKFGYTTYSNRSQYGHSVILGGADIYGVEHAQAYSVFANGGKFVQNEAILKIEDSVGNIIYEYKPSSKKVGDARAAHMINYSLSNCFQASWDGRDVAAKTGTSQNNADAWTVLYSPDFVTVGWMGNNNNKPMKRNAFGVTAVMPWLKGYMKQVGETKYFKKSSRFKMPTGLEVTNAGGAGGFARGLKYKGRPLNIETGLKYAEVCIDQRTKLARPVDINRNKTMTRAFPYYKMPIPYWQGFLDSYLSRRGIGNGGPTSFCTVDRN